MALIIITVELSVNGSPANSRGEKSFINNSQPSHDCLVFHFLSFYSLLS